MDRQQTAHGGMSPRVSPPQTRCRSARVAARLVTNSSRTAYKVRLGITRRIFFESFPARGGCTSITAVAIESEEEHRAHASLPGMFSKPQLAHCIASSSFPSPGTSGEGRVRVISSSDSPLLHIHTPRQMFL